MHILSKTASRLIANAFSACPPAIPHYRITRCHPQPLLCDVTATQKALHCQYSGDKSYAQCAEKLLCLEAATSASCCLCDVNQGAAVGAWGPEEGKWEPAKQICDRECSVCCLSALCSLPFNDKMPMSVGCCNKYFVGGPGGGGGGGVKPK